MAFTLAPSLERARKEVDVRYKNHKQSPYYRWQQDAWLGDHAHNARPSGHNPDAKGVVHAKDFAVAGLNPWILLNRFIGDPRVWYVIYDRKIWSKTNDWKPKTYKGSDPHTLHIHVSLFNNQEGTKFPAKVVNKAATTATGWGLASLVRPKEHVVAKRRIPYEGRPSGWAKDKKP